MDEKTREEIVAKIDAKRKALGKLAGKPDSMKNQIEVYENALKVHEEKIEFLKAKIAQFKETGEGLESTFETRTEELAHMEDILVRYDAAVEERGQVSAQILGIVNADNWMPGDDPALRGAYRRSPEYTGLKARLELLDNVIENALKDIRKISVSRGVVSDYHKRELGKELPV